MTVNKRLLFGSLAVAAAALVAVTIVVRHDGSAGTTEDVTLASGGDLAPQSIGTNAVLAGRSLPKVDLQTLSGDTLKSSDLIGRPLVINFWYSTCLPCKKELPAFAAAHATLGDDVRFVGVDTYLDRAAEEKFARDKGVQYELLYDPTGELTTAVGIANFPQTILVDANGTIVQQSGQLDQAQLEELIRTKLL